MPARPLRVASTKDLGPLFLHSDCRVTGQDGAYTIPLADGRVLWYFGDTLVGERPPGSLKDVFSRLADEGRPQGHAPFERLPTNTGTVMPAQSGADGITDYSQLVDEQGEIRQLVSAAPGDRDEWDRMWCMHGIELDGTLYLSYMHIRMLESSGGPFDMGFEIVGTGFAKGNATDWQFERLAGPNGDMWWTWPQPQFANAMMLADDWLYVYGVVPDAAGVQRAYVGRVRPADIEDLAAYEYFAGDAEKWSSDVSDAASLFEGPPNEMSVSYNAYLGSYLAVHTNETGAEQVARTAPDPWGPWSESAVLWTVEPWEGKPYPVASYAGKEHPCLADDGGRTIYLTYVEAEEYRPHLIQIELA